MNTPGIEFGRKTSAAYAALCKPSVPEAPSAPDGF